MGDGYCIDVSTTITTTTMATRTATATTYTTYTKTATTTTVMDIILTLELDKQGMFAQYHPPSSLHAHAATTHPKQHSLRFIYFY